jgi:hypothetical protein
VILVGHRKIQNKNKKDPRNIQCAHEKKNKNFRTHQKYNKFFLNPSKIQAIPPEIQFFFSWTDKKLRPTKSTMVSTTKAVKLHGDSEKFVALAEDKILRSA